MTLFSISGYGFVVLAMVIIFGGLGKLFMKIYEFTKTTDKQPVQDYLELLRLLQKLKEESPEVATAVRNNDPSVAAIENLDEKKLLSMLDEQKEAKKKGVRGIMPYLMTFLLGVIASGLFSAIAFGIWLFW